MKRPNSLVVAMGIGLVMAMPGRAHADSATVSYQAVPECPSRDAFRELVHRQGRGPTLEVARLGTPEIVVAIDHNGPDYVGRLEVTRAGVTLARTVTASTCAETVSALAFVISLALTDGTARDSANAPNGQPPQAPEADPAAEGSGTIVPPDPNDSAPWQIHVGMRGVFTNVAAPGWNWGESAFVELRPPRRRRLTPTVRVGMVGVNRHTHETSSFVVTTWLVAGRAEASPIRLRLAPSLDLLTALGLQLGCVNASTRTVGSGWTEPAERELLWFDMFVGLRLELRPISWFALEAQAELTLPITRHNYPVNMEGIGYQISPAAGTFAAGLLFGFR